MFRTKNKRSSSDSKKLVAFENPHSTIAEEFRSLRSNIQFSNIHRKIQTIMVTSASPNEGKSTIVANLALAYAIQKKKVLLVDADLRNPSLHKTFHVPNHRGLTTFFTEESIPINEIAYTTPQKNLFFISSGILPPNPSELLASPQMDNLIIRFQENFDLILFDTPPTIKVTDAQILASKTEGTIYVVRKDVTERKNILKTKALLEHAQANIIGVVFNDKKQRAELPYGYS